MIVRTMMMVMGNRAGVSQHGQPLRCTKFVNSSTVTGGMDTTIADRLLAPRSLSTSTTLLAVAHLTSAICIRLTC